MEYIYIDIHLSIAFLGRQIWPTLLRVTQGRLLTHAWGSDNNTENQQFHGEKHHHQSKHLISGSNWSWYMNNL